MKPSLDAGLAELRQRFRVRLRHEAEALHALAAELPSVKATSDIGRIAHRLAGGAAVFGCPELEQPAVEVEDLALASAAPTQLLGPVAALISMMRNAGKPDTEASSSEQLGEAS